MAWLVLGALIEVFYSVTYDEDVFDCARSADASQTNTWTPQASL
jgi:hypothetical protein